MAQNDIILDILRKEYEFISKSIDDQYKYVNSLFTAVQGMLTFLAGIVVGVYKAESTKKIFTIVRENSDFILIFLLTSAITLIIFRLINLQAIVKNVVYKEYLERKINSHLNHSVLIWNSKILKKAGLAAYSQSVISYTVNITSWAILIYCLWAAYNISSKELQDKLFSLTYVLELFLVWYLYIVIGLPKQINETLRKNDTNY